MCVLWVVEAGEKRRAMGDEAGLRVAGVRVACCCCCCSCRSDSASYMRGMWQQAAGSRQADHTADRTDSKLLGQSKQSSEQALPLLQLARLSTQLTIISLDSLRSSSAVVTCILTSLRSLPSNISLICTRSAIHSYPAASVLARSLHSSVVAASPESSIRPSSTVLSCLLLS